MKKFINLLFALCCLVPLFSQTIPLTSSGGSPLLVNLDDVQYAFVRGSGALLQADSRKDNILVAESVDSVITLSCNNFLDVLDDHGTRTLINKRSVKNITQWGTGAKITMVGRKSTIFTSTLWASVVAQSQVPVDCGRAFAELFVHRTDPDTITFAGTTPDTLTDLIIGDVSLFDTVGASLRYTGTYDQYFYLNATASFSFSEASTTVFADVYVNGVLNTSIGFEQDIAVIGESVNASASGFLQLSEGDLVHVRFSPSAHTGSDDLVVTKYNLSLSGQK